MNLPIAVPTTALAEPVHEQAPGRSQACSSPTGGLAQRDRFGGTHEEVPGRSQACVDRFLSWSEQEHLLLVKRMGQLQKQMTQLVNGYEAQLSHWQRRLMRQSIRLMLARTRGDWGLLQATPSRRQPVDTPMLDPAAAAEAEALICKTGCMMDNHHWRDGDQCLRTGMACLVSAPAQTGDRQCQPTQDQAGAPCWHDVNRGP